MLLSEKDKKILKEAEEHAKMHVATEIELLLLKLIDEKVQDISYECFEVYKNSRHFANGLDKFNDLSMCLIDCTEYLQSRKNNIYEAIETVVNFASEVVINHAEDKLNGKPFREVLMAVCENMEYDKEYSVADVTVLINDWFYNATNLSPYLSMFINLGFLERIRPGVYKRVKLDEL